MSFADGFEDHQPGNACQHPCNNQTKYHEHQTPFGESPRSSRMLSKRGMHTLYRPSIPPRYLQASRPRSIYKGLLPHFAKS